MTQDEYYEMLLKPIETEGVIMNADGQLIYENIEIIFDSIITVQNQEKERQKKMIEKQLYIQEDNIQVSEMGQIINVYLSYRVKSKTSVGD